MAITKTWAVNSLNNSRNSLVLVLAAMRLLNSDAVYRLRGRDVVLRKDGFIFDPEPTDHRGDRFHLEFDQLVAQYDSEHASFIKKLGETWKFARRNLMKESFEVVLAYAKETTQVDALRSEPWHAFARIIRNCISHDHHFRFRPSDLRRLPVTWNGLTVDASLQHASMMESHLDPQTTWKLFDAMEAWLIAH